MSLSKLQNAHTHGWPEYPTTACVVHYISYTGEAIDNIKAGIAVAELRYKILTDALHQHVLENATDSSIVADGGTRTHLLTLRAGHALHIEVATDTITATEDLRHLLGEAAVNITVSTAFGVFTVGPILADHYYRAEEIISESELATGQLSSTDAVHAGVTDVIRRTLHRLICQSNRSTHDTAVLTTNDTVIIYDPRFENTDGELVQATDVPIVLRPTANINRYGNHQLIFHPYGPSDGQPDFAIDLALTLFERSSLIDQHLLLTDTHQNGYRVTSIGDCNEIVDHCREHAVLEAKYGITAAAYLRVTAESTRIPGSIPVSVRTREPTGSIYNEPPGTPTRVRQPVSGSYSDDAWPKASASRSIKIELADYDTTDQDSPDTINSFGKRPRKRVRHSHNTRQASTH